jgi:hypothetical protein
VPISFRFGISSKCLCAADPSDATVTFSMNALV